MRNKTKIVLVILLFVPIIGFAFVPLAVASHGELNSFIRIPSFGINFPSNWHSAPWQTMLDSWDPETSRLIMYWWCDPFDDLQAGVPWDPELPDYNGDDEIVIGFGMGLDRDYAGNPLTQKTAKEVQESIELKIIIDWDTETPYEVDLRISPVVYIPHSGDEGWPVYFYRVGTVFRAGELKAIIGPGPHTLKLVFVDIFGEWNSDMDVAFLKMIGVLPPEAPDTCWFNLL